MTGDKFLVLTKIASPIFQTGNLYGDLWLLKSNEKLLE